MELNDYTLINAEPTSLKKYWKSLWKYRRMISVFALQEIKVSYAQTFFGLFWLLIKPLIILGVFTFLFDNVIQISGMQHPYALFAFSGLIAWNYFNFLVGSGSGALISNQHLIRKMYFPRMVLPLAKVLVGMVEAGVSFLILFAMMVALGYSFSVKLFALFVFLVFNIISGLGIALWLNALNLRHRDLNHFIPVLIGFLIWLTPVFYPSTLIPQEFSFLLYLNPIAGIIECYRWAILGDPFPSVKYLISFAEVAIVFISGVWFFIRMEDVMADYL